MNLGMLSYSALDYLDGVKTDTLESLEKTTPAIQAFEEVHATECLGFSAAADPCTFAKSPYHGPSTTTTIYLPYR